MAINWKAILGGAGAGFLVAGPPGAVAGALLGYVVLPDGSVAALNERSSNGARVGTKELTAAALIDSNGVVSSPVAVDPLTLIRESPPAPVGDGGEGNAGTPVAVIDDSGSTTPLLRRVLGGDGDAPRPDPVPIEVNGEQWGWRTDRAS